MKPIRVLFDNQIFQLQSHGGISRYFTELIREFNSNPSLGIEPVLSQDRVHNKHLLNESGIVGLKPIHSRLRAFLNLLSCQLLGRRSPTDVDIIHATFYFPGFFPKNSGAPVAVTVYDMIPELYPDKGRIWNPHFQKERFLRKADLVFAISESAANDMKSVLGIDRESTTTYLGVGTEFQSGLELLSWISAPYFVFVGNRSGYKDADVAFESFALVAKSHPELRLVLVGGGPLSTEELNTFQRLGIAARVTQRNVSSPELPSVYSNALGLLYPTRYEGFGLPLLEAMATEIPVLCSNTDINREIAGEAGNFFEVGNFEALSELMASVIISPEGFKDKLLLGKSRSKEFTWRRCAEITANSYRKLLESQRRRI